MTFNHDFSANVLTNSGIVSIELFARGSVDYLNNTGTLQIGGLGLTVGFDQAPTQLNTGTLIITTGLFYKPGGSGITSIASSASLSIDGNGSGILTDDGFHTNELANLTNNAGSLTLGDQAALANQAVSFSNSGTYTIFNHVAVSTNSGLDFANSGSMTIDGTHATGGSTLVVGGTLSNSGVLHVGSADGSLSADSSVTASHLTNSGTIALLGGTSFRASLVDTHDAAPSVLSSGVSITLTGNAVLQFASGTVTAISAGAQLILDGTHAHIGDHGQTSKNSALTGLDSNAGILVLGNGAAIANSALAFDNTGSYTIFNHTTAKTNLDFTNGGVLALDQGAGDGGSQLKVGTALDNSGTLSVGNSALSAGDTVSAATLTNSGTITLRGGSASDKATLSITGDIANSGTMDIGVFSQINKDNTYTQTAGETDVGGTLKAATVLVQGGILQGIGTVIANINDSGGDVAGGDFAAHTLGTLHIQGKLVDSANVDATLVAETGDASLIAVSGPKVSLKGATLHLDISNPDNLTVGETFTILTFTHDTLTFGFTAITDGPHTGDGNSLDLGNGFTLEADYDKPAGHITLTVADSGSHAAPLAETGVRDVPVLAPWHADGWIG